MVLTDHDAEKSAGDSAFFLSAANLPRLTPPKRLNHVARKPRCPSQDAWRPATPAALVESVCSWAYQPIGAELAEPGLFGLAAAAAVVARWRFVIGQSRSAGLVAGGAAKQSDRPASISGGQSGFVALG